MEIILKKNRRQEFWTLLFRVYVEIPKYAIYLKMLKTQWNARMYDKFMFQRHENRGTKALEALESRGWTTFQPFYHGEKRRSCAKRVRETRERTEGENNRGEGSLDGPLSLPLFPRNSSGRKKFALTRGNCATRCRTKERELLVTRCNPRMALNASSRSKLCPVVRKL